MKITKKLLSVLFAAIMVIAMSVTAFAEGTGTITVTNATKNQTYYAYKLMDATYSEGAVSYTVKDAGDVAVLTASNLFVVGTVADAAGNYSVSKKSTVADADVIAWIEANKASLSGYATPIDGTFDDATNKVTFSGLDFGYYYIESSLGTVVTIDTAAPNANVEDKNPQGPDNPDKNILAENGTDLPAPSKTNDAAVGSIEKFEIKFDATNWKTVANGDDTKITVYNIVDTPTNIAINLGSVAVTVNGDVITNYTKALDDNGKLSVNIPWVDDDNNFLYDPKAADKKAVIPVVITYNAEILEGAAVQVAKNIVDIHFNNDPTNSSVTGNNPPKTDTYTYKFKLNKVDQDGNALKGAEFELYLGSVADANKVSLVKDATTGDYRVADADDTPKVTNIEMGEDASVVISGLDNAAYVLREIVVPAGYNKCDDVEVATTDLTKVNEDIPADKKVDVKNYKGSVLPSTGGIGTTMFYAVGALVFVFALVLLVTRKRMQTRA